MSHCFGRQFNLLDSPCTSIPISKSAEMSDLRECMTNSQSEGSRKHESMHSISFSQIFSHLSPICNHVKHINQSVIRSVVPSQPGRAVPSPSSPVAFNFSYSKTLISKIKVWLAETRGKEEKNEIRLESEPEGAPQEAGRTHGRSASPKRWWSQPRDLPLLFFGYRHRHSIIVFEPSQGGLLC